jgi:hypothetical protein
MGHVADPDIREAEGEAQLRSIRSKENIARREYDYETANQDFSKSHHTGFTGDLLMQALNFYSPASKKLIVETLLEGTQ